MKIAIDITPLQSPHRHRGIGSVIIHFINNLSAEDKNRHEFVFYTNEIDLKYGDPLEPLDTNGLNYTVVKDIKSATKERKRKLPHKINVALNIVTKSLNKLAVFYFGDDRLETIGSVDVFLQLDQMTPLPKGKAKKALVLYDIIPYVLEADYLWSYSTARAKGCSVKGSLWRSVQRWFYIYRLKLNSKRADILLAISQQTKDDFVQYVGVRESKITVTPLGVDEITDSQSAVSYSHYIDSGWGYIKKPYQFDTTVPYLLFVGGVDPRRKLTDVITAFNRIRASGQPLKLVLAGDILQGPENVPVIETRNALQTSSYKDDIVYMGFVTDTEKNHLYNNALAFMWPSLYEGFGLPVLEAMAYGTPVITRKNSSIYEVAENAALYAEDALTTETCIRELLALSSKELDTLRAKSKKQASRYQWSEAAKLIVQKIA